MRLDRLDLCYDDTVDVLALHKYIVLDLGYGERELTDKTELVKTFEIDEIADPIH